MFSKAARLRAQAKVSLDDSAFKGEEAKLSTEEPTEGKRTELAEAKVRFGPAGGASLLRCPSKLYRPSENASILEKLQKHGRKRP